MEEDVKIAIRERVDEEPFARKLGLRLVDFHEGYSKVEMQITPDLMNMLGLLHGGAIFSLVDEAFQIAVNSRGDMSVALNMSISYLRAARLNDRLIAEAREIQSTRRTAHYDIRVTDQNGRLVACSHAIAYKKNRLLPFLTIS